MSWCGCCFRFFGKWKEGESVGVIEVTLFTGGKVKEDGERNEREAHEDLEDQDFHSALLLPSAREVDNTTVRELTGMMIAHRSGDIRPHAASVTVIRL
jgi:hypothetical protein